MTSLFEVFNHISIFIYVALINDLWFPDTKSLRYCIYIFALVVTKEDGFYNMTTPLSMASTVKEMVVSRQFKSLSEVSIGEVAYNVTGYGTESGSWIFTKLIGLSDFIRNVENYHYFSKFS